MIAFVRRPRRRAGPGRRRGRGRRHRPVGPVHPGHAGRPADRRAGAPADLAGRARGLADAVRLRRRGRAGGVRAAADRQRRRPAARPGDARRARPRRAAPRRRHRGPRRADARCPASARKGAQRIVLELKDRLGAVRGGGAVRRRRRRSAAPAGATRCTARCSAWAGRPARPTRPWRRRRRTPTRPSPRARRRTSAPCCRSALRSLSRRDDRRRGGPSGWSTRRRARPRRGRACRSRPRCGRAPWPSSSASTGSASSSAWCSRPPAPRPGARPRAALRPARAGQDHAGDDRRRRARAAAADHQRSGDPARRRPGRAAVLPDRGRGALPRRDPPDGPAGRGDALHGDGGLPGRRRRRQGPRRHRHPAGDPAVHPGRRHHPGRAAARPAARPVRLHRPHGLLRRRRARARAAPLGPAARRPARPPAGRARSPAGPAARPASPTGCCAGSATTPRSGPTASVTARRRPRRPCCSTRSTSAAWTASTGRCCTRWSAASAAGPVGLSTLAVAVGEEPETVEEVAEPFLVRAGLLARTPRGRVATPAAWRTSGLTPPPQHRRAPRAPALFDDVDDRGGRRLTVTDDWAAPRSRAVAAWRPGPPRSAR